MWRRTKSYHIAWWVVPRKLIVILCVLLMMVTIWQMVLQDEEAVPAMAEYGGSKDKTVEWYLVPSGRDCLLRAMPVMAGYYGVSRGWQEEWRRWSYEVIDFCSDVRPPDWVSILARQFPHQAVATLRTDGMQEGKEKVFFAKQALGDVQVGIYHTHTAESFIPSSGKSHVAGGECGEIVEVGAFLAECLAKHGVRAVQNSCVHDYPNFMHAYSASEKTASRMVADYPSLGMMFDIHRDASKRADAIVSIDGVTAAKVLIIVAQGQDGLPQPHWQENYRLAKALEQKMEELYPGLSGGIQLTEWRYNQHLHPHALLLEVGSHETSKGEAMRSMKMMADVIARVLAE